MSATRHALRDLGFAVDSEDLRDGDRVRERNDELKLRNVLPVIDKDRLEVIGDGDADRWSVEIFGLLHTCQRVLIILTPIVRSKKLVRMNSLRHETRVGLGNIRSSPGGIRFGLGSIGFGLGSLNGY